MNKEEAKEKIKLLIEKFSSQIDFYKSLNYNETQTRQDFINPFFETLGWDIDNKKQQLETYRDVRHEDRIKVNGHTKAPDYSFNIEGKRKFFVEAKKPAIPIRENSEPALQIRNYGWNANLSISVLTDFEEFAIYDCTKKPKNTENANAKRLKYIYYTDYLKNFDFIYDTFCFENVLAGSIEKFAKSKINFKTAEPVDKEFLKSIESWREYLATTIALRNNDLEEEDINFSVQQIIDRIVFLKVCEDRKIEKENNLFKLLKSGDYYQNLYHYFQIADQKYNSGLFDFKKDTITKNLEIDNKVIKNIITELYGKTKENEKEYGYNFAIIPVEILGLAYEQFLGKVIKLTSAKHAQIEEKPEVRKAGGVYYTPEYIVDFIVKNTVGKIIENKTPEEISKIKILDPSCGSGSFLLGAYQYLLDYHLKYYNKNRSKLKLKENPITADGNLTSKEKKEILLNNIFGVDIDTQAVEVTKLSLLLKALEGETETSIQTSLQLFNERVLPTIDNNIQCGNSLISTDFYDTGLFLTPKEERKINVFDWKTSFSEIFNKGGFDCVIGNPPYVRIHTIDENSINYFLKSYKLAQKQFDLYNIFIEKSFKIVKQSGLFSFIIPSLFIKGVQYENLRKLMNENSEEFLLKEYGDGVFEQVKMPTCIFISKKGVIKNERNYFQNKSNLFSKIDTRNLEALTKITRGIEIGRDKLKQSGEILCITGGDIDCYKIKNTHFIDKIVFDEYNKKNIFLPNRIIVRETGNKFFATIVKENLVTTRSIYNLNITDKTTKPQFLLGILNSKLFDFYFKEFIAPDTNIFPKIRIAQLKQIPIPQINIDDIVKKEQQNKLIKFVDSQLELNNRLQITKLNSEKEQLQRRIEHTENEINKLVYSLFEVSEDEIINIEN